MSPPLIEPSIQSHTRYFINVRRPPVLMVTDNAWSKRHGNPFVRSQTGGALTTFQDSFKLQRQFRRYRRVVWRRIRAIRPAAPDDHSGNQYRPLIRPPTV